MEFGRLWLKLTKQLTDELSVWYRWLSTCFKAVAFNEVGWCLKNRIAIIVAARKDVFHLCEWDLVRTRYQEQWVPGTRYVFCGTISYRYNESRLTGIKWYSLGESMTSLSGFLFEHFEHFCMKMMLRRQRIRKCWMIKSIGTISFVGLISRERSLGFEISTIISRGRHRRIFSHLSKPHFFDISRICLSADDSTSLDNSYWETLYGQAG
jgi:hypothetical protein